MATIDAVKKLLLISNSTLHGRGYLAQKKRSAILSEARRASYSFPMQFMTAESAPRRPKNAFAKWDSHSHQSMMCPTCRELSKKLE